MARGEGSAATGKVTNISIGTKYAVFQYVSTSLIF
jgi:hypothetical protein